MDEIEFKRSAINSGDCIGTGWRLTIENFGTYLGVAVVALIIYLVASFVSGLIPLVGPFIPIIVSAPLAGGFYYMAIKNVDGEQIDFSMMFTGFEKIGPLIVLIVIENLPSIAILLLAYTGQLASLYGLPLPASSGGIGSTTPLDPRILTGISAVMLAMIFVWIIFSIVWTLIFFFSVQLVMDKDLGPMEAITTSVRAAFSNAGGAILLLILCWLILLLGALAVCLGLFLAVPIYWVAKAAAYRAVFPKMGDIRWTTPPPPTAYDTGFGQGMQS